MIAVAGSFLSELAAALCSFICVSLNSSVSSHHIEKPVQKISEIGHMALPLTLNRLLLSVLAAIEVVLIPQCLRMYGLSPSEALSLYGVFTGMALPCILFPSTVTSSASVILMPSVAEMHTWTPQKKSAISHVPPVLPVSFSDLYAPPFFTLGEILPEPYFSIIQMPDSTFVHFHLSVRFFIQILHLPVF